MNNLLACSPILTRTVMKTLIEESSRQYFIIKPSDLSYQKMGKKVGNFAVQALFKTALAMVIATLPLFLLADLFYMPFRSKTLPDCHYQLSSPAFSTYLGQMQGYVRQSVEKAPCLENLNDPANSFEAEVAQFILFIKNAAFSDRENNLKFHQKLIDDLRHLLNQKNTQKSDSRSLQFLQDFSKWLYTGPQLTEEMKTFLKKSVLSGSLLQRFDQLDQPQLCQFLSDLHTKTAQNKRIFPGLDNAPRYYDAHRLGDTPSLLFELTYDTHSTKLLRTPAVVMDTKREPIHSLVEVSVVPEFRSFLDNGETHLYVNLMEMSHGSEKIRSKAIEQLQRDYSATFHLIALDKDSDFYHQKHTPDFMEAETFKTAFLQNLFKENPSFFWPNSLLAMDWEKTCEKIIEDTYTDFFSQKTTLSRMERQDFIEIAYYSFVEDAIRRLQPATCAISCRSSLDRAPNMVAGLYANHQLKKQKRLTPRNCQEIAAMALAPAILMQNRAPFKNRTDRMISALNRMGQSVLC